MHNFHIIKKRFVWAALVPVFAVASVFSLGAQNIRLNQIGFYQYGPKQAVIVSGQAWRFAIKSPDLSITYYSGDIQPPMVWAASGETAAIADFSDFSRTGTFVLDVPGVGTSYPFHIGPTVHRELARGLIKAFYYQRASTSLPAQYAGAWSRSAGHPDDQVFIHASAVSDSALPGGRRAGDVIASPKGWYDAGDYGKYVVNAGITVYTLLSLYERFPGYFDTVTLTIPRQADGLPDILEEIKWELDWLLTMQDPSDGGVYHKLTSLGFCGFIMPGSDIDKRYIIGKGSTATFDFAAVCAAAYRIYKNQLPRFADSCLSAARYAWTWGSAHPNVAFRNPSDISTGEYGDGNPADERLWAATELYLATEDPVYGAVVKKSAMGFSVPGWPSVSGLSTYSLAFVKKDSAALAQIVSTANDLGTFIDGSAYRTVMYNQFYWGSNGVAANDGMVFMYAFLATKNPVYFNWAVQTLDYLVGRNAVGRSFVTGFGTLPPMHPHHRPSSADGIADPVPGFLVGGPNSGRNDAASCNFVYPSTMPAKSWVDEECAYACNEVAINWNAPAAFLAGALEAIYADTSNHVQTFKRDTLPPAIDSVAVTDPGSDHVTIRWETGAEVSASLVFGVDSSLADGRRIFSANALHHGVTLTGLSPSTMYFFKITAVDAYGVAKESPLRSFTTRYSGLREGFSFDPAALNAVQGSDVNISFKDRGGLVARLAYTVGGESAINYGPCTETSGTYTAVIPGSKMTASGILYYVTLADSADTVSTAVWSLSPSTAVERSNPMSYPKAYQLISFPLYRAAARPFDVFSPLLGDSSEWRFFGYNADSGAYTANDSLRCGHAGWLYCAQKKTLQAHGMALKPDTLFPITLSRGWNLIGNPFTFPVYWENTLVRSNGVVCRIFDKAARQLVRRQLFGYSDTTGDQLNNGWYYSNADALQTLDTTRLVPWQGYWVYAEKSGVELLLNPQAGAPQPFALKKDHSAGNAWRVRFSASVHGTVDNTAIIGASAQASDGDDELDSPKPPVVSNDVTAGFVNPRAKGVTYCADIVSAVSERGHEWTLIVKTSRNGEGVTLSWQRSGTMKGFAYLIDRLAGLTIDLAAANSYTVALGPLEKLREFTIKQTTDPDMSVRTLPVAWSLGITSPNPFKMSRRINFSIPMTFSGTDGGVAVAIAVYDMLGRRVRALVNDRKFPGYYSIVWNGTDDFNRRLRQGVYIVHLNASGFSSSAKTRVLD